MNSHLTIKELAEALAESTGKTSKSLERFLKALVTVVRDNALADRTVQIKGIGSFKVTLAEQSESVDAETQERIVVPEHYELTFTPDKEMRKIVNSPFAFFEPVEITDDADIPITDKKETTEYMAEDKKTQQVISKDDMEKCDEKVPPPSQGGGLNDLPVTILTAAVAILLVTLGVLLYVKRDCIFGFGGNKQRESVVVNVPPPPVTQAAPAEEATTAKDEAATKEEPQPVKAEKEETQQRIVTVKYGDRLNLFALKYYGNKLFWVYIYEQNRAKLGNPDNIPVGIKLVIPPASKYGIDANNPESVQKAAILQAQLLEPYRAPLPQHPPGLLHPHKPSYHDTDNHHHHDNPEPDNRHLQ